MAESAVAKGKKGSRFFLVFRGVSLTVLGQIGIFIVDTEVSPCIFEFKSGGIA